MGDAEIIPALVTPEEYLAAEALAERKHEYIGGSVYALPEETVRHHLIASNALGTLGARVRGHKCRAFNFGTKVRVRFSTHTRFYYPDAQVVSRMGPQDLTFQDEPAVIVEVVSENTRRIDEQEKREGYLGITSVFAYVLLEQKGAVATVWRRHSSGFASERWVGLEATVPFPEIDAVLPLAEVYEAVEFPATRDEGDLAEADALGLTSHGPPNYTAL